MDILTYALARKCGGGGNGALTGLKNITLDDQNRLVFEIEGKEEPIVSQTPIPAASAESIRQALESNPNAIRAALDIPEALTTQSYQDIQAITEKAITSISLGKDDNGQDIILQTTEGSHELPLPLASGNSPGLVKGVSGSDFDPETYDPEDPKTINKENINKIYINNDGTMSVYALDINRLVQSDDDELIMGDID